MAEETRDWSQMPPDILAYITKYLKTYTDYIRLRSVCTTFSSFLPSTPPYALPPQLPWLLLSPSLPVSHSHTSRRTFYNLSTGKVHSLFLPEASYPRKICGSSHGWLVIVGETPEIFSYNPLSKTKVFLPRLSSLPSVVSFSFSNIGREYMLRDPASGEAYPVDLRRMRDHVIRKVVLSHSGKVTDGCLFIALAIVSSYLTGNSELVYCIEGDATWKEVAIPGFFAEDVIYCEDEGLFYAVNKGGDIAVFDVNTGDQETLGVADVIEGDLRYLVKSGDELFLVCRCLEAQVDLTVYHEVYETVGFDVYRLCRVAAGGEADWQKVTHLDDLVLFVGETSSLALSASVYPECKGSCIYFTDDHSSSSDVGVFDMRNGRIEPLPCYPQDASLHLYWTSPIWFAPNPSY